MNSYDVMAMLADPETRKTAGFAIGATIGAVRSLVRAGRNHWYVTSCGALKETPAQEGETWTNDVRLGAVTGTLSLIVNTSAALHNENPIKSYPAEMGVGMFCGVAGYTTGRIAGEIGLMGVGSGIDIGRQLLTRNR